MDDSNLKFGTSGLRGLAVSLDGGPAIRYARAFAEVMIRQGRLAPGGEVLIGRDLRASSESILQYCCTGLRLAGAKPVDCGAIPTPAVAYRAMALAVPAIVVTGSHIPEDRNGLKFYRPDGEIDKHDEAAIADAVAATGDSAGTERSAATRSDPEALTGYVDRALAMLEKGALAGMKIGVYQHSSVARDLLVEILDKLGADSVAFSRSDTFVPIDTEALRPEDAELCRAAAVEHDLDAIVSTDGDADRPLIADENGHFLRGDLVGTVAAAQLGADCVVTPVTSNSGIERCGSFSTVVRTRIGSPYVIEGMNAARGQGARTIVGFEANGGVLVGTEIEIAHRRLSALPTRDALAPILAVLFMARREGLRISGFTARFGFRAAGAGRLQNVSPADSSRLLAHLLGDAAFRTDFLDGLIHAEMLDSTDGVRLKGSDGAILHYRASGNAPELRCYVEAETPRRADALLEAGLDRAREYLKGIASS